MLRFGVLCTLLCLLLAGEASAATCSSAEKADRTAKAEAYARDMPAARAAYFRTHRAAAARRSFVRRQQAELARLRSAAACTLPPPRTAPEFTFAADTPAAEQAEVRDDVAYALDEIRALTGVTLKPPAIYLSRDAAQLAGWVGQQSGGGRNVVAVTARAFAAGGITAEAGWGAVFVVAFTPSWEKAPAAARQKILAHELFHLVQQQLMKADDGYSTTPPTAVRLSGPTWLNEGAAESIGYRIAAARGLYVLPSITSALVSRVRGSTTPLQSLDTYAAQSLPDAWDTMWLGADRLVQTRGVVPLVAYWSALGDGLEWRAAFAQAFGLSVDAWYGEFAAYRATL